MAKNIVPLFMINNMVCQTIKVIIKSNNNINNNMNLIPLKWG